MKQPTFKVTCSICGGEGLGTLKTSAALWDSNSRVVHSNPDDCRRVLERKAKLLEKHT